MTVQECYEQMGGDYADVMSRLRTDERILRFLGKVADDGSFALLCSSLQAHTMEEAFRAAHTLKGICMNLSLTKLYTSANALTEALRGRAQYGDDLPPLLDAVKADYENTVACIRALQQQS
ncbi:MAG: Hpt domain-containing protein [Clostridiales bacterium]|nr:Hpt domain-containing protein [Clostridiales bacterium]